MTSNLLSEVPSENYFKFADGKIAKNLEELYLILNSDANAFAQHVDASRNDYADWIRNCVLHVALADRLAPVKDRDEYLRILGGELQNLKMGVPATVPADNGLDSIDAELNSVLDEEILAAMNDDSPSDTPAQATAVAPAPVAAPVISATPIASPTMAPSPVISSPVASSPAIASVQDKAESFEFEEVFKPLIEELSSDIFTWE